MNFTLIIKSHGRKVQRVSTHSIRIFYRHLRSIKWKDDISTYLRVSYGKQVDNFNQKTNFYNDGDYVNKNELFNAFEVFTEI